MIYDRISNKWSDRVCSEQAFFICKRETYFKWKDLTSPKWQDCNISMGALKITFKSDYDMYSGCNVLTCPSVLVEGQNPDWSRKYSA